MIYYYCNACYAWWCGNEYAVGTLVQDGVVYPVCLHCGAVDNMRKGSVDTGWEEQ